MKKEELLLLVLDRAGEKGLTPAQLQKAIFLLSKNFPSKFGNFYDFQPYNYGPFDKCIYLDFEKLEESGLAEKIDHNNPRHLYSISSEGHKSTDNINIKAEEQEYIKRLVAWIQTLTFQELISTIYKKYPEYKANSIFRG